MFQEGGATYWAVRRQTAKHFGPQAGDLRTIRREVVFKGCGRGWVFGTVVFFTKPFLEAAH